MKRVLSLVLALVLVLGSVPMVFAADMTGGEQLQEAGFISGDQDGNLMEEDALTRAQSMVLVAQLNGVFEEAKSYSIPGSFSDVDYENDWFAPYVAYAEMAGWTAGYPDGTFKPNGNVSEQELCAIMMNALDYDVVWETVIDDAAEIGITVTAEDATALTRGESFETMWTVVSTVPKNGSDVPLGVELGKLEPTEPEVKPLEGAEIDEVKAVGNTVVEVTFEEDVDAAAAAMADNYMITEKGDADKVIEVISVVVADTDRVLLTTDEMDANDAYTLTVAEDSANFVGIKASTAKPKVSTVKATDTNVVEVKFDRAVDYATATDVDNYSLDKDAVVVAAELNGDNDKVTLTTEGVDVRTTFKLTVQGVASIDGVEMSKVTKSFTGKPDTKAPSVKNIEPKTSNLLYVHFTDDHGVDKEMIEDVSNWDIDKDLEVVSVTAEKKDHLGEDSDYYNRAVVETTTQKASTKYTVTISNLTDGSTSQNVASKDVEETFYGKREDTSAPTVGNTAEVLANDKIVVTFSDASALDEGTVLDPANYEIDNDAEVLSVEWDDEDADRYTAEGRKVVLTTTEQDYPKSYRMYVTDVADEFGNAEDKKQTVRWSSEDVQTDAPYVTKVNVKNSDTVELTFSHSVEKATAEDPTNYNVEDLGYVTEAKLSSDKKVVTLEVPEGTAGKTYDLYVDGVTDYYGNEIDDLKVKYTAVSTEIDTTDFDVTSAYIMNNMEVRITFNKDVTLGDDTELVLIKVDSEGNEIANSEITADFVTEVEDEYVFNFATKLGNDTDVYKIKDITVEPNGATITDKYGNELTAVSYEAIELFSDSTDAEQAVVEYIEHTHPMKVTVYFDQPMTTTGSTAYSIFSGYTIDEDDESIVYFNSNVRITDKTNLTMNLNDVTSLKTLGGANAEDKDIEVVTVTYDDVPVVTGVEAVYNNEVEVTFDQDIQTAGTYKITDEDDKTVASVTPSSADIDGNVVTVTWNTSTKLKGNEVYTIEVRGARTYAGKVVETEKFDFEGTGVVQSDYVTGVEVVGTNRVIVKSTANNTVNSISNTKHANTSGAAIAIHGDTADQGTKTITLVTTAPMLDSESYTISTDLGSYTFKGLVEDGGLAIDASEDTVMYVGLEDAHQVQIGETRYDIDANGAIENAPTLETTEEYYVVVYASDAADAEVLYAAFVTPY